MPDGEKLVGHQAPEPTFPVRYLNLSKAFKMGGREFELGVSGQGLSMSGTSPPRTGANPQVVPFSLSTESSWAEASVPVQCVCVYTDVCDDLPL